MEKRISTCDYCGRSTESNPLVRWLRVEVVEVRAFQDHEPLLFDTWACLRDWATVAVEGGRVLTPEERAGGVEISPPPAVAGEVDTARRLAAVPDDEQDRRTT